MDALSNFQHELSQISSGKENLTIKQARKVVKQLNEFLYCTNPNEKSRLQVFGSVREYFSEFHKYWEENHEKILGCKINNAKCEEAADALHNIYVLTNGSAFTQIYDTAGLTHEQICQVRMLTANQDFRGSRSFKELAEIYKADPTIFDVDQIAIDPVAFTKAIGLANLSQTDKRVSYAQNIANLLKYYHCTPYELISKFNNDVFALREALINKQGAGYGNKKADMFIRDMVVLGVWKNVKGFDKIDVASDVNTIKVALRTGIIKTAIPVVSSFLDIYCYQYSYMDKMNALAWRKVWEIWSKKYPNEALASPCLMDYFVYGVIGRQFCKEGLIIFQCTQYKHIFPWHSAQNRTCQVCYKEKRGRVWAEPIDKMMPCASDDGEIAILNTDYVRTLPENQKIKQCPFKHICGANRKLMPPKSISIMGQTGWTTAYAERGIGGGGLMA